LGAGKGNGKGKGGGGQFTRNLGPGWTRIAPHRKEGFQVSERDSGAREGRQPKGRLTRGNYQRDLSRGLCHVL
jgi:hypothetical protein